MIFSKMGFPLFSRKAYMVSGKFGILAIGATFVGYYYNNLMLTMLGALLLGAYVSQMFPIWKEFDKKIDNQEMAVIKYFEPLSKFLWISILVLTFLMLVIQFLQGDMHIQG